MLKKLKFDSVRWGKGWRSSNKSTMRTAGTTRRMSYMPSWTSLAASSTVWHVSVCRLPTVDYLTSKWYLPMPHFTPLYAPPHPFQRIRMRGPYCIAVCEAASICHFACLARVNFNSSHTSALRVCRISNSISDTERFLILLSPLLKPSPSVASTAPSAPSSLYWCVQPSLFGDQLISLSIFEVLHIPYFILFYILQFILLCIIQFSILYTPLYIPFYW